MIGMIARTNRNDGGVAPEGAVDEMTTRAAYKKLDSALTQENMRRKRKKIRTHAGNGKKRAKEIAAPEPWTWKEKLLLGGIPLAVLVMSGGVLFLDIQKNRSGIEERVDRLKLEHNLTELEFQELRAIELDFHSYENIMSFKGSPSPSEAKAHEKDVRRLLGVTDSASSVHDPIKTK